MMPPPPIPSPVGNSSPSFPTPMTNGTPTPPVPAQLGDPSLSAQNPGMLGDPQLSAAARDRARQAQIARAQQANRQMSPPSNPNPGMNAGQPAGANAIAGPSGGLNPASMPPNVQQLYSFLQTPNHPFVQYMIRHMPGFQQMPVQTQLAKMIATQVCLRFVSGNEID